MQQANFTLPATTSTTAAPPPPPPMLPLPLPPPPPPHCCSRHRNAAQCLCATRHHLNNHCTCHRRCRSAARRLCTTHQPLLTPTTVAQPAAFALPAASTLPTCGRINNASCNQVSSESRRRTQPHAAAAAMPNTACRLPHAATTMHPTAFIPPPAHCRLNKSRNNLQTCCII